MYVLQVKPIYRIHFCELSKLYYGLSHNFLPNGEHSPVRESLRTDLMAEQKQKALEQENERETSSANPVNWEQ